MSQIAQESSALAPRPKLLIKPSDLVHFQVSLLESHRTSEQQKMVPKLLLQGVDNKTKLKNSHPQTSQHHTPAITSKALGLARIRRDTGCRKQLLAGSCPMAEARVARLSCPRRHIQSTETSFPVVVLCLRVNSTPFTKRQTDLKDRKHHQTAFPVTVFSRRD